VLELRSNRVWSATVVRRTTSSIVLNRWTHTILVCRSAVTLADRLADLSVASTEFLDGQETQGGYSTHIRTDKR
jgi:hypothetical protein